MHCFPVFLSEDLQASLNAALIFCAKKTPAIASVFFYRGNFPTVTALSVSLFGLKRVMMLLYIALMHLSMVSFDQHTII